MKIIFTTLQMIFHLTQKNKHKVLKQHIFVNNKKKMTCTSQKIQFNDIFEKIKNLSYTIFNFFEMNNFYISKYVKTYDILHQ
jgi:hypothetical protein